MKEGIWPGKVWTPAELAAERRDREQARVWFLDLTEDLRSARFGCTTDPGPRLPISRSSFRADLVMRLCRLDVCPTEAHPAARSRWRVNRVRWLQRSRRRLAAAMDRTFMVGEPGVHLRGLRSWALKEAL